MWTPTTREQHSRKALRYQADLTDAKWVVIEPHLPPAHGTGRPRSWPVREIVNGIFYVLRAGCPWRGVVTLTGRPVADAAAMSPNTEYLLHPEPLLFTRNCSVSP